MSSQHNDSESNATEHAITTWQEQRWRRSKECQHVIIVFVSFRSHRNGDGLQRVLGQNLPALLNEATQQDGFFEVLEQGIISDGKLLDAVIDFLTRWQRRHNASYQDLLADAAVSREAATLLPTTVSLWKWINGCLGGQLELSTQRARTDRVPSLRRFEQIAEEDASSLWIILPAESFLKLKLVRRHKELLGIRYDL